MEMEPKFITLKDGRKLAYAEYGEPAGKPVFFFHGTPGSHFFHPPDGITQKMGVRLITVDRPGYGLSTFLPKRRILDWPGDITNSPTISVLLNSLWPATPAADRT